MKDPEPPEPRRQSKAAKIGLLVAATVLAVTVAEGVLRIAGFTPKPLVVHDNEPTTLAFDSDLGWKNKPGRYRFPAYHPDDPPIRMTFLPSGRRITSADQKDTPDGRAKIVLIGGSFTQGFAISDDETFAWKLQERFPSHEVLNFSVAGYGTYQSLLTLERALPQLDEIDVVVYGYNVYHEQRNAATAEWLETLQSFARRDHVYLPYVTLGDHDVLVRHRPERYATLPAGRCSAVVSLIERSLNKAPARGRGDRMEDATAALIMELRRATESRGARLVVPLLQGNTHDRADIAALGKREGFLVVDCSRVPKAWRVRDEGHPGGQANTVWAGEIGDALMSEFSASE